MTIRIEITAETPEQFQTFVALLRGEARLMPWGTIAVPAPELSPEELAEAQAEAAAFDTKQAAAHPDEGGPATPVEPAPVKARRRTKAEIEAAKAADAPATLASQTVTRAISETPEDRTEPGVAEQTAAQPEPTPPVEAAPLSHDDIRRALKVIVDAKGMPVATKALMDLGYGKTSDVPAEKIAEVIAALRQVAA